MTGPSRARRGFFARPEDLHCVVFHVVTLCCYASAFWVYQRPELAGIEGPWSMAAFVLAAAYLLGWISGIDVGVNFHNHTHRRIFKRSGLNRWFGRLWTFSGGWPSFYWQHAHVVVHHANVLEDSDWSVARRRPDGSFESLYKYILLHWPWRYAVHFYRDFRHGRGGRRVGRKALEELAIFAVLYSIPFWIDPIMALCLWVLPHWIGNVVTMGSGMYVQHAGAVPKTAARPVSHSNTYLSRFFNVTMFNIGYHTDHHDFPAVHWADLPAFHERRKQVLIEGGAHVLSCGYYGAANLLSSVLAPAAAQRRFMAEQAPGYGPSPFPLPAAGGDAARGPIPPLGPAPRTRAKETASRRA